MVDFVLGLFIAGLLVRGWLRGFVREALDLVALFIGLWIAFRLSGPLGEFLTDRFSVSPEVATIGAGVVLFLLFGVAMSIAAHYLSRVMSLPGLNLINRLGGAAVAALWGIAIILVVINVARVVPGGWDARFENSSVAQAIAGPDAVPQQVFETMAPDGVLGSLAAIQGLFGVNRIVPEGNEVLTIPPAAPDEVRQVRDETAGVLEQVNEHRTGLGLSALGRSVGLDGIAESRADGDVHQRSALSGQPPRWQRGDRCRCGRDPPRRGRREPGPGQQRTGSSRRDAGIADRPFSIRRLRLRPHRHLRRRRPNRASGGDRDGRLTLRT